MNKKWKERIRAFSDERWAIGVIDTPIEQIVAGEPVTVQWVRDRKRNRWFADPFILEASDETLVFLAEEMYYPRGVKLGRISRVTVDRRRMRVSQVDCLLELSTHLSFPAYYREGDEVLVYPENSASGHLTLYRYDVAAGKLEPLGVLCDDPVADAIITTIDGQRYMMATRRPSVNGDTLLIYRWDEAQQRFVDPTSVKFDERVARMAGNLFTVDGQLIRPTQECNVQYGHAVTLQRVSHEGDQWAFTELRRLYSTHPRLRVGSHTFNYDPVSGLTATDALGFDRMWFRRLLRLFHLM